MIKHLISKSNTNFMLVRSGGGGALCGPRLRSFLTACRKEIDDILTTCRKEAKASFPLPLSGPHRLEGTTLSDRLAGRPNCSTTNIPGRHSCGLFAACLSSLFSRRLPTPDECRKITPFACCDLPRVFQKIGFRLPENIPKSPQNL